MPRASLPDFETAPDYQTDHLDAWTLNGVLYVIENRNDDKSTLLGPAGSLSLYYRRYSLDTLNELADLRAQWLNDVESP